MAAPGRTTFEDLCECVRAFVRDNFRGRVPLRVRIDLDQGEPFQSPVPDGEGAGACRHSEDFRSVVWYGKDYRFTPAQAAVVRALWLAWEAGAPELGAATLLELAGSDGSRLRDLFKGTAGWAAWEDGMIGPAGKGAYRLYSPDEAG